MTPNNALVSAHPLGESKTVSVSLPKTIEVETYGGKIHVEWDPQAAVTPLGQVPFFIDFLKTADLFLPWVDDCPLSWTSPNAPGKTDILGTMMLSVLAGHHRYAHITTMRADTINPPLLGMKKVASEDSVRRAFHHVDEESARVWLQKHFKRCYEPLLYEPWILDIDTSVKPLYGHQEGAEVGYNPQKPGRPSHTFHTYFAANIRLVLDVEMAEGKRMASIYTRPGLWNLLEALPREAWPAFLRGDCAWGTEGAMSEAEEHGVKYLFKIKQSLNVKKLIKKLCRHAQWEPAGQDFSGAESTLKLMGWSRERRVIVLRRRIRHGVMVEKKNKKGQIDLIVFGDEDQKYEYQVLVTSLTDDMMTSAQHYRDRADCENNFDELKNQWGWSGFTTHDLKRCRIMARIVALTYNWWSLFVRLAIPERHAEAITSRPLLLQAVGRQTKHAGQTTLTITSTHAYAENVKRAVHALEGFLRAVRINAEQFDWLGRWLKILSRIFIYFLKGRALVPPLALPAPA